MKTFRAFMPILLILALAASLLSCGDPEPSVLAPSIDEIATQTVEAILPAGESNAEVKSALLALFDKVGLEKAEIRAVFGALQTQGDVIAPALLSLKDKTYTQENADSYRTALQAAANAVSPEIAGEIYYAVASEANPELAYTLSDCRKLAPLLLGQDPSFGWEALQQDNNDMTAVQINTILRTLSASLRMAVGIGDGAKEYLYSLAAQSVDTLFADENAMAFSSADISKSKELILSVVAAIRDGYDAILTYTADYLAFADARLIIGLPYEKQERLVYVKYSWEDWTTTPVSEEEYLAHEDEDDYFSLNTTVKGFTIGGTFLEINDEDALLADKVYRLLTAYRAYSALDEKAKESLRLSTHTVLTILSDKQAQELVAGLLNRSLTDSADTPVKAFDRAAFDQMLSELSALSAFDATDGITKEERDKANRAIASFESYLHSYLPKVY